MGLAICNNFVKMMGGTLNVRSRIGEGSQFVVRLTLLKAVEETEEVPVQVSNQQRNSDLTGIRILLAEDNSINAEIATILLEKNGAQVTRASNGREAVNLFGAAPEGAYSLILMDIQMPVMDGLEASHAIRKMERPDANRIPIIGLSANAFQEDIDQALQSGMNGYLPKPVDVKKLCDKIAQYL